MGKTFIVSSWRGILRLQGWPRKRGPAKHLDDQNRQLIFRLWSDLIKRLGPKETLTERQALIEHNRRNRGQRGSAAIRLRDWQTQRLYGRGIAVIATPQLIFWPPAIQRDAADILDHATAQPGQVLQRTQSRWGEIALGAANQVLTAGTPGTPNTWQNIPT